MTELSAHKQTSAKIRELFNSGKSKEEIQKELRVDRRTINNALWYMIKKSKEAPKPVTEKEVEPYAPVILYAERDKQMRNFYASLNTKGALSVCHTQDMGKVNTYTRKSA